MNIAYSTHLEVSLKLPVDIVVDVDETKQATRHLDMSNDRLEGHTKLVWPACSFLYVVLAVKYFPHLNRFATHDESNPVFNRNECHIIYILFFRFSSRSFR